jgi:hypothetical protein
VPLGNGFEVVGLEYATVEVHVAGVRLVHDQPHRRARDAIRGVQQLEQSDAVTAAGVDTVAIGEIDHPRLGLGVMADRPVPTRPAVERGILATQALDASLLVGGVGTHAGARLSRSPGHQAAPRRGRVHAALESR